MEVGAGVAKALVAGREGAEVLCGLGHGLAVEAKDDAAERLVAVGNVKVDLVGDLGALGGLGRRAEQQDREAQGQGQRGKQPPEVDHGGDGFDDGHGAGVGDVGVVDGGGDGDASKEVVPLGDVGEDH